MPLCAVDLVVREVGNSLVFGGSLSIGGAGLTLDPALLGGGSVYLTNSATLTVAAIWFVSPCRVPSRWLARSPGGRCVR